MTEENPYLSLVPGLPTASPDDDPYAALIPPSSGKFAGVTTAADSTEILGEYTPQEIAALEAEAAGLPAPATPLGEVAPTEVRFNSPLVSYDAGGVPDYSAALGQADEGGIGKILARTFLGRAPDLVANMIEAPATVNEAVLRSTGATPSETGVFAGARGLLRKGAGALRELGYSSDMDAVGYGNPSMSSGDALDAVNPVSGMPLGQRLSTLGTFVPETLAGSAMDMAATLSPLSLAGYMTSRTNEVAKNRAANDNRQDVTLGDVGIAAPAAALEALLERFTTMRLLPHGTTLAAPGAGAAASRIARELGIQSTLGGAEELAPYLAEGLGTETGISGEGALETFVGGALAEGALGATAQGVKEVAANRHVPTPHVAPNAAPRSEVAAVAEPVATPLGELAPVPQSAPTPLGASQDPADIGAALAGVLGDPEVAAALDIPAATLPAAASTAAISPSAAEVVTATPAPDAPYRRPIELAGDFDAARVEALAALDRGIAQEPAPVAPASQAVEPPSQLPGQTVLPDWEQELGDSGNPISGARDDQPTPAALMKAVVAAREAAKAQSLSAPLPAVEEVATEPVIEVADVVNDTPDPPVQIAFGKRRVPETSTIDSARAQARIDRMFGQPSETVGAPGETSEIAQVVRAAQAKGNQQAKAVIHEPQQWLGDMAREQAGMDIDGFSHVIDSSAVRHTLNNHGDAQKEVARGQLPVTAADFDALPDVVDSPQKVVFGTKNRIGRDQVGFLKKMPDGTWLYFEEARTGKRELASVTLRKYPATMNAESIVSTLDPNAQGDGGNGLIVADGPGQASDPLENVADADTSRTRGESEADRLGLRSAVDDALGKVGEKVIFLHGYEGLPEKQRKGVQARAEKRGGRGKTAALYDPKTRRVYLFTDVVTSPSRAAFHAAHEIAGHEGLRTLLGDGLNRALDIALQNPTVESVAKAIAGERNLDMGTEAGRLLAAEEALAELAAAVRTGDFAQIESRYKVPVPEGIRATLARAIDNFLKRLKAAMEDVFGRHQFSDEDVRALLENAWQAVNESAAEVVDGDALESVAPRKRRGEIDLETRTANFRRWSDDAPLVSPADAMTHDFKTGKKVVVEAYHGAKRPDRIGKQFNPKRATSGPMVYFTANPEMASNYATGKADTSLANEDQEYATWFKVKVPGSRNPVPLDRAWFSMPSDVRQRMAELAPRIHEDDGVVQLGDEGQTNGIGNYDWEIKQNRGNVLRALVEGWLNSGALFGEEQQFMEVLELVGFPMDQVTYDSPFAEYPAVFPVFIRMQKPLVSDDIPAEVEAALQAAAKRDRSRAQPIGSDMWDKNTRTLREWVENFSDKENGERTYVWTSIPDKVTEVFKSLGYDGIIDVGGKGGGDKHRVYVPFSDNQVKGVFNKGGFNEDKRDLLESTEDPAPSTQRRTVAEATPRQLASDDVRRSDKREAPNPGLIESAKRDVAEQMEGLRKMGQGRPKNPRTILQRANALRSIMFDSVVSRARAVEARNPEVKSLRKLLNQVVTAPGDSRLVGETLNEATEAAFAKFTNRVRNILSNEGMDRLTDQQNDQLRKTMLGTIKNAPAPIQRAATRIRKLMDVMREDMLAAGIEVGEVEDVGYLTRLYDEPKILANEAEFLAAAGKYYREEGFPGEVGKSPRDVFYGEGTFARFLAAAKRAAVSDRVVADALGEIREIVKSYRNSSNINDEAATIQRLIGRVYDHVANSYGNVNASAWLHKIKTPTVSQVFNGVGPSGAPITKERVLTGAADTIMADFMNTNMLDILDKYARVTAKKVAMAERFGPKGEKVQALLDSAANEGVPKHDLDEAAQLMESALGGYNPINPSAKSAMDALSAWTYLSLLSRVTFSSAVEAMTFAVRTGDLRHAAAPLVQVYRAALRTQTGKDLNEMALLIGANGNKAMEEVMQNQLGGDYGMEPKWSKLVHRFMVGTLLTPLTRAQRAYGVGASTGYLRWIAKNVVAGKRVAEMGVYLNELGIADHQAFSDWLTAQGTLPDPLELHDENGRPTPRGQDYMTAVRRMTDQTIQNPNASHRPSWMNNPVGRLAGAVMGFSYASYENIIKREISLNRSLRKEAPATGAAERRLALALGGAAALAIGQTAMSVLRELLFNAARFEDKDDDEIAEEMVKLGVSRTFGLGSADPMIQYMTGLKYRRGAAETMTGASVGGLAELLDATVGLATESNSPSNDTAEYRAMEQVYSKIITPAANLVLSRIPYISGAAIPAFSDKRLRAKFAGLFFDAPDQQTEADRKYLAAIKDLEAVQDDLKTRLALKPIDQWETELAAMKDEYSPLLDGVTLEMYKRDGRYGVAGEPKRDAEGRPSIALESTEKGKEGSAGTLLGELDGYPTWYQNGGKAQRSEGSGSTDRIAALNKMIKSLSGEQELTRDAVLKSTQPVQLQLPSALALFDEVQANGSGSKPVVPKIRLKIVEELQTLRREEKRAVVILHKMAEAGEPIPRNHARALVARALEAAYPD